MHGAFNTLVGGFQIEDSVYVISFWSAVVIYWISAVVKIKSKGYSNLWCFLLLLGPMSYPLIGMLRDRSNSTGSPERLMDVIGAMTISLLISAIVVAELSGYTVYGPAEFVYSAPEKDSGWEKVTGFSSDGVVVEGGRIVTLPGLRFINHDTAGFEFAFVFNSYDTPLSDYYICEDADGMVKARLRNGTLDDYLFFFPPKMETNAYFEVDLIDLVLSYYFRSYVVRTEVDGSDVHNNENPK